MWRIMDLYKQHSLVKANLQIRKEMNNHDSYMIHVK